MNKFFLLSWLAVTGVCVVTQPHGVPRPVRISSQSRRPPPRGPVRIAQAPEEPATVLGLPSCFVDVFAYSIRCERAEEQARLSNYAAPMNDDKEVIVIRNGYEYNVAVFGKGLIQNDMGEILTGNFEMLYTAAQTGLQADWDSILLTPGAAALVSPQAGFSIGYAGPDSWAIPLAPAPPMASEQMAAGMIQTYGSAILRDQSFFQIQTGTTTQERVVDDLLLDLNSLPPGAYPGPFNANGQVDRNVLFRGNCVGCLIGPYVSQLAIQPFFSGNLRVEQYFATEIDQKNSVTQEGWLQIMRNLIPFTPTSGAFGFTLACSPRAFGSAVHNDPSPIWGAHAVSILWDRNVPLSPELPGRASGKFVTFGQPDIVNHMGFVAQLALRAAWRQKWSVNLTLRPEKLAGRVHFSLTEGVNYNLSPSLLNARTTRNMREYNYHRFGQPTFFLPQIYPEGAPAHPSYPAGHATLNGAVMTLAKAFFDDEALIGDYMPILEARSCTDTLKEVEANPITDPWLLENMTVGGELDKLAFNIGTARDFAGVHYQFDSIGVFLGEEYAIRFLSDLVATYSEDFPGFSLTKFDGERITITGPNVNWGPRPGPAPESRKLP